MTKLTEYVAAAQHMMVLGTSVDEQPSVRVVGFAQDAKAENIFYVVSAPKTPKLAQIQHNKQVAFVTFPGPGGKRISTNQARASVSSKTWPEIAPLFADSEGFKQGHPHPEDEVIIEIQAASLLLDSFVEPAEVISY